MCVAFYLGAPLLGFTDAALASASDSMRCDVIAEYVPFFLSLEVLPLLILPSHSQGHHHGGQGARDDDPFGREAPRNERDGGKEVCPTRRLPSLPPRSNVNCTPG